MSLASGWFRVPLGVQVGVVAALFVAALAALWTTGASVVARERRRSEAKSLLDRAGRDLDARGQEMIARAGEFPDFPDDPSRSRGWTGSLGSIRCWRCQVTRRSREDTSF